jgi:pimeloyl-ACP methyl ester carboxylesterase
VEDTEAAIEFMHDRGIAEQLHSDPHRIVLIGHSLGGFLAAYGAAHEPYIYAVAMMSAVNLGGMADAQGNPATAVSRLSTHFARSPMEPLKGCTARSLAAEIIHHRADWNFDNYAEELSKRPVLLITADDGLYGHEHRLGIALKKHDIASLTEKHFATDHCYSSTRIELEATVLNWLSSLDSPSDKGDLLRAANTQ